MYSAHYREQLQTSPISPEQRRRNCAFKTLDQFLQRIPRQRHTPPGQRTLLDRLSNTTTEVRITRRNYFRSRIRLFFFGRYSWELGKRSQEYLFLVTV